MNDFFKRLMDVVGALVLMVVFLPVWIVVPIAIYLDSGRPIIFKHRRLGKGGKEFDLYKFRSMVVDADEILHRKDKQLLAEFKNGDWKLANDPRITRLGRKLRSLTLDEFPQFLNVLRGDMSLVGPRAYLKRELTEQVRKYPETKEYMQDILTVKPGLSGPWQVGGRNEIPFNQRAKMDAMYARNRTFWGDVVILLKTPQAMLSRW